MRFTTILATGTALAAFATAGTAHAAEPVATVPATAAPAVQAAPPVDTAAQTADAAPDGDIVVTARQREESLKDVPIAITALTGAELHDRQVFAVKDIAAYTPGLSINSDSVGRAFVSIRGIGTTLIDTVQPGVGIFIDGVYQPNTSYLNSPINDVARIEVLRGPQGTLFGNNTLGGAINVITRQPSDVWTGRVDAAVAGPDDYASVSGSVSGPIAPGLLQFRLGAAYHAQNGFGRNTLANARLNPLEQSSVSGTLRFTPASWAVFSLNANYDHVYGGSTQYNHVSGPTDYSLDGATNVPNRAGITYKGVSLKSEFQLDSIHTKLTSILAYNRKDVDTSVDGDYSTVDLLRASGTTRLITKTVELRADTQWSDNVSTLIGVYGDRYVQNNVATTILDFNGLLGLPAGTLPQTVSPSTAHVQNDTRAVFGTVFVKLGTVDIAVGGRYDHQRLVGSQVNSGAFFAPPDYVKSAFQPRVTLTNHWTSDFMTYASVSKGIRGGGQNGPGTRPQDVSYKGDFVWTYEVGTKFSALDHRLTINADVFYNDYHDFIGQNSLAPNSTGAGFVAINLNTGHVKSYGAELEAHLRVTPHWRFDAGVSWLHARITDDSEYLATTGTHVSTDHVIFTPDYNFNVSTNYIVPVGANSLIFDAGIVGKGSRYGSSLDPLSAPLLKGYTLTNASIGFRFSSGFEIAAFGTNLFNTKYIESYIDKSALVKAGLAPIASNLAIQGDRRRYGVRASFKF
ncbi:MAG: TonB-dependent receptor [Sphingomonas bacterium]|uniref:TonB-dependent receptor n=1 Tax=Sphingomonas bacterium TaxID=1895847 RepID=UPI0026031DE5|nr:TonB-dependent receptor [Sphingomonas bacterium]MDB5709479.1 TonB-dependent receptor [Sphingomonas bacterium]